MQHCLKSAGSTLRATIGYLAKVVLKLTLWVAALGALVMVFIYATSDSTSPGTAASLDTLVSTAHENRVSYYQNQDWCQSISSAAGNYVSSDISTCGGGDKGVPFDAQGTHLFDTVSVAAEKAALAPIRISIEAQHGQVTYAQVDVACVLCYASYIYSPQRAYAPERAEHATVTAMPGHWYYVNSSL